jgi:hypothetical protein
VARFNYQIEPMMLGNMRQNGVRSLSVSCWIRTACDRGGKPGAIAGSDRLADISEAHRTPAPGASGALADRRSAAQARSDPASERAIETLPTSGAV